eukprot:CAMPEP_0113944206 /NCGR_PEP_ID=MMETSP1339-20121228/31296_1 /TAXON_ID=94617 /ORGANISM="Fibrocapsa japonica" /LENGTH=252 /DNA_ID=CAMNT_0000949307 /DNA_START=104 /DNA_END=862 /DNA_ORIENTATION=+ /assembly_acc=CAM_ASM_000762
MLCVSQNAELDGLDQAHEDLQPKGSLEVPDNPGIPIKGTKDEKSIEEKVENLTIDKSLVEVQVERTEYVWSDVTHDGGIRKSAVRAGSGDVNPSQGDTVEVHYVGTLKDSGKEFDNSRKTTYPFKFEVGAGSTISGWDYAVKTMVFGEVATFEISAEYAYADAGSGDDIGPGATLLFEMELVGINNASGVAKNARANEEKERLAQLRAARAEAQEKRQKEQAERVARKEAAAAKLQNKGQKKGKGGKGRKKK